MIPATARARVTAAFASVAIGFFSPWASADTAQPKPDTAQPHADTAQPKPTEEPAPIPTWGAVEPGKGFLVGRTSFGDLSISGYALVRYLNQLPATQSFVDHLGDSHPIDTRNDIYSHRVMVF